MSLYILMALTVGMDCGGEYARPPKLPEVGSGPVPLIDTVPLTVAAFPPTVMLPFEWTSAGTVPETVPTVVEDSIARLPPVRIAFAGLYGAKMYSALIIRLRAPALYEGDQPIA